MKLIKKEIPSDFKSEGERSTKPHYYWIIDENIEIPHRILGYVIETNSSAHTLYPLLYQLATKSKKVLELGIGPAKSSIAILDGLKDGFLWSIDWGNVQTRDGVEKIKKLGLDKNFTWIRKDFFSIPDKWFKNHKVDLIFVDFNPERLRPQSVYKEIYRGEPYPDKKKHPRNCRIMIEKLLLTMKQGSLLVMRTYKCFNVTHKLAEEGKINILWEHKKDLRFIILRKK